MTCYSPDPRRISRYPAFWERNKFRVVPSCLTDKTARFLHGLVEIKPLWLGLSHCDTNVRGRVGGTGCHDVSSKSFAWCGLDKITDVDAIEDFAHNVLKKYKRIAGLQLRLKPSVG